MGEIAENLEEIRQQIQAACLRGNREPSSVKLIAVSKTFPAEAVREAFEAGQIVFGENRLQEATPKIEAAPARANWHFIGKIQRNKVRGILPRFDVIHSVDSLRLATYMDDLAVELSLFPKVFIQVNVGGEESKGGFEPEELREEWENLLKLKRLEIIGLMCIPPISKDAESARTWFVSLRELRDELVATSKVPLPFLSMGMSGDFEVAIEEGATHVRVGSAIFGRRIYQVDEAAG